MTQMMYRLAEVKKRMGLSRSSIYLHIAQGLFPKPVKLGLRAVGWPSDEVDKVLKARVANYRDIEIKCLVMNLEYQREQGEEEEGRGEGE
jgi:prophage regulatory protein